MPRPALRGCPGTGKLPPALKTWIARPGSDSLASARACSPRNMTGSGRSPRVIVADLPLDRLARGVPRGPEAVAFANQPAGGAVEHLVAARAEYAARAHRAVAGDGVADEHGAGGSPRRVRAAVVGVGQFAGDADGGRDPAAPRARPARSGTAAAALAPLPGARSWRRPGPARRARAR